MMAATKATALALALLICMSAEAKVHLTPMSMNVTAVDTIDFCVNGSILVSLTNDVTEKPVGDASIDVFLASVRYTSQLFTNDTGQAMFSVPTNGTFTIEAERSGFSKVVTTKSIVVCVTTTSSTSTTSTSSTSTSVSSTSTVKQRITLPTFNDTAEETTTSLKPEEEKSGNFLGIPVDWDMVFGLIILATIVIALVVRKKEGL